MKQTFAFISPVVDSTQSAIRTEAYEQGVDLYNRGEYVQAFTLILENFCLCLIQRTLGELPNFGVMIWQLYYMLRSALICFQVTRFRNKGNHFI